MPTLACWWLSIHFDEYLVLCGYSHYIFGRWYLLWIIVYLACVATSFGTLGKCYFDQMSVYSFGYIEELTLYRYVYMFGDLE